MKKTALFVVSLLLSFCFVACQKQEVPSQPLAHMVMVDGEIYYETGLESPLSARCGTMDGEITSSVKENEVPNKNNESNFGVGYGYQYAGEGTIDIIINEKWMVFANETAIKKNPFGLMLSAKNITSSGCTLVFQQSGGSVLGELQTGVNLNLYQWIEEQGWVSILPGDVAWNQIAYSIQQDAYTEIEINWSYLCGELAPGHYKIEKEVMDFQEAGKFQTHIYETSFELIRQ